MRLPILVAVFAAVVLVAYRPAAASGSRPPVTSADTTEWVNLQILPDSISRAALIGMMRGFTDALGVRCGFCHVREGEAWDFPSDANPHKEVARGMMRMTTQINREILPAIDGMGEGDEPQVTCWTCHRGATHPESVSPAPVDEG